MPCQATVSLPKYSNHVVRSYGAMNVIMAFLRPSESICLQQLDKWWYQNGVSRVQTSVKPRGKLFIFHDMDCYLNSGWKLIVYNSMTGEVKHSKIDSPQYASCESW